jgi:hypothetical protein
MKVCQVNYMYGDAKSGSSMLFMSEAEATRERIVQRIFEHYKSRCGSTFPEDDKAWINRTLKYCTANKEVY